MAFFIPASPRNLVNQELQYSFMGQLPHQAFLEHNQQSGTSSQAGQVPSPAAGEGRNRVDSGDSEGIDPSLMLQQSQQYLQLEPSSSAHRAGPASSTGGAFIPTSLQSPFPQQPTNGSGEQQSITSLDPLQTQNQPPRPPPKKRGRPKKVHADPVLPGTNQVLTSTAPVTTTGHLSDPSTSMTGRPKRASAKKGRKAMERQKLEDEQELLAEAEQSRARAAARQSLGYDFAASLDRSYPIGSISTPSDASPWTAEQSAMSGHAAPHYPANGNDTGDGHDIEPLYVNAKQYHRILKRRIARERLKELHRLSTTRKVSCSVFKVQCEANTVLALAILAREPT